MPKGIPKSGFNSSRFKKGVHPWNYGKKTPGVGGQKKGCKTWSKGLTIKDDRIKNFILAGAKARKGKLAWNSGKKGLQQGTWKNKHLPDEMKKQISKTLTGKYIGENACNWKGGKSTELYGTEWNIRLKRIIRDRDHNTCQLCGKYKSELSEELTVHHIDYDKKNNTVDNLISLCRKCHMRTNGRRDYWYNFFRNI